MAGASDASGEVVARVFLSYRREDTGQVVARLAEDLEAALGAGQVFYDRERLQGGDVWRERLAAAIRGSDVVVALIGKGWVQARRDAVSGMRRLDDPHDPVRLELETALGEARSRQLRIVPVLVAGAPRPDEHSLLPTSIQDITAIHTLPLRTATNDEWKADVARIAADLGIVGRGRSRDDARDAEWVVEHLHRLTARVAQRLAASAPVRGEPVPRHINLSLVERRSEERPAEERPETRPEMLQKVYDLEQLASQDRAHILVLGEGGAGKTTSLLHVAETAAERARVDPAAPVPVYVDLALLMQIEDIRDLEQLVAGAEAPTGDGVSLQGIAARRPCLFLFDAFNEVPEHLHRNCVVALRRFVDTWGDRHRYIVSSRAVPGVEPLEQPPASFTAYHLLRLTAEQVEGYLDALGLAVLHERMPEELRDLARNPFMLVAIARTLEGTAAHDLPRNRGKLYQRVLETWMRKEAVKRRPAYDYERVKAPVLSYLAMRMTAAGQTALSWREVEPEVEQLLVEIHRKIQRRGGMPDRWTVDEFCDEIVADDILQKAGDRVAFRHQSFQEYFAACWFARGRAEALVELTPRLVGALVEPMWPVDLSGHRLVPVLTMVAGLVEDCTKLVEALAERNPVTAAATIASASRIAPAVRAGLEQRWIEMLRDGDPHRRVVACSCLRTVARSPASVRVLVEFALSDQLNDTFAGSVALSTLSAVDELATQLVEAILALDEERYLKTTWAIRGVIRALPISRIVVVAFERWRAAHSDDALRSRLEVVLVTVDRAVVVTRLGQVAADTTDAVRAADAARVLASLDAWGRVASRLSLGWLHRQWAFYEAQRNQEAARLKDADVATLAAALAASDDATRAGAARVAADQRVPLGDAIIDTLLRVGVRSSAWRDLVAAAVHLVGEASAIARLVEVSHRGRVLLRHLDASALATLPAAWETQDASDAVSIRHQVAIAVAGVLGGPEEYGELEVAPSGRDGRSWRATTHAGAGRRYEVCVTTDGLDIFDLSRGATAIRAVAEIGPQGLAALRAASDDPDPDIRNTAIEGLARLSDPELADRLLQLLRHAQDPRFVAAALTALVTLRAPQAVVLIEDLLGMTGDWSEVHPVWRARTPRIGAAAGWGDVIHGVLAVIRADREVAAAIDAALATGDVDRKCAALRELSRWLSDTTLEPERAAIWRQQSRDEQLVELALHDPAERVRREAADALRHVSSRAVVESIAPALDDGDPAVRLAAGSALLALDASPLQARAQQLMLAIATSPGPQTLRRAAGDALSRIAGGLDPIYQPIRVALARSEPQAALDLIAGALEIVPDDGSLLLWLGQAQSALGLRSQAAASFRRAFELEGRMAAIPTVLAETLIDLGDFAGAAEAAWHGVDLSADSADAHALLAWSCYRANTIAEAVDAARMACDLDPVHPRASWILVLALLRTPAPGEARAAAEHALRVRQLLSPGLDTSFVATFEQELATLAAADEATAQLIAELRQRLAAPVQSPL